MANSDDQDQTDIDQEYEEYMRNRIGKEEVDPQSITPTTANSENSEKTNGTKTVNKEIPRDQTATILKEAVDKLCAVQSRALESERNKLKTKQNQEAPKSNLIMMRSKIQRQYQLTAKSSFEVWLDSLRTELTSWMLLDLIDPPVSAPVGISEIEKMLRKNYAKEIIINHIDEDYHKKILGITEPMEILQKLRQSRKGEVSSTPTSIRTRLYNLRMSRGERVHDFCERFDQIIREHEMSDDVQRLTEQEMRSTFYQAIIGAMPEVRRTDSAVISTTGKEMDMAALRKTMYRIQEDNDATGDSQSKEEKASRAKEKRANKRSKCYRCNRDGHWQKDCYLSSTNQWFCYVCNCVTDHKGDDCSNTYPSQSHKRSTAGDSSYEPPVKRGKTGPNQTARGSNQFRGRASFRGGSRGGRGNFRGRGAYRGSAHQQTARRVDYDAGSTDQTNSEGYDEYAEYEDSQGKSSLNNNMGQIEFIADSGATSHIVNKSFVLSDFKKSENGVIKSANKNEFADIVIDGRGNLLLKNNKSDRDCIKLTNVIAAKDISENLLSLRKLADAGFCIYLDDKIFRVYNKENNKIIFKGVYEKPNWIVRFEVKKINEKDHSKQSEFEEYSCTACLAADSGSSEQSQTNKKNDISNPEGDNSEPVDTEMKDVGSTIGRESLEDPAVSNTFKNNSENTKSESRENLSFYKTIRVDELKEGEDLQEILEENLPESSFEKVKESEAMLWHQRLGHASLNYLRKIQKKEKQLEHVKFEDSIKDCEICIMSKMEKLPFKQNRSRAERPLQIIHTDIMGPIKPVSWPSQKRYIIVFVDDYSRYARAYCLKSKDESGQALESFLISARNLLGVDEKVCYIRSDRGTEFTGGKFAEVMKKENIESNCGPPYTPELNGTAERFNKSIQKTIRAQMSDSGLPSTMWELAVEAAVHSYNRTPHKSIGYEVPLLRFSPGAGCHLESLRRFGSIAYVKLPFVKTKFSKVAVKAVLVAYTPTGYILWHPSTRKFVESRHVRFIEKLVYKDVYLKSQTKEVIENTEFTVSEESGKEENLETTTNEPKKKGRPKKVNSELNKQSSEIQNKENNSERLINTNKGPVTRSRAKKIEDISFARYIRVSENREMQDDEMGHILLASIQKDPITFEEATNSENKELWKKAIEEELESLKENKVWVLVNRPKEEANGKRPNIIDSRWLFKRKVESDGSVKYKARLVSRGFKDKNIYGLRETYAPVARLPLIRAVLSIINKENLEVTQMDVKTAFLNGKLEEKVFMEIPEGLDVSEEDRRKRVCKLERSLYGLVVSPKLWNKRFSEEAQKLGLENDLHEPCLFTWREKGKLAIVILYVDDMLIASNDSEKMNQIKSHLSSVFQMKDLGEPKCFLGLTIERDRLKGSIAMHQATYTQKVLQKFNMHESKSQSTPMVTRQVENRNNKCKDTEENSENCNEIKRVPFREAIGSLMYLANATRPDITFAVNCLARKQVNPTEDDWMDVKRIFRYLRGTTDLGVRYLSNSESLEAISDASFRDCEDSKSTGGYLIRLFGDVIAWRSHKQSIVTTSTCEAEYLAMSDASQELISLDKSIRYIVGRTFYPITLWCDNRSARDCTEMEGSHKLKAFDQSVEEIQKELAFREKMGTRKTMADTHGDFIKQCVNENKIRVCWVPTEENLADIMIKPLPQKRHNKLRDNITQMSLRD